MKSIPHARRAASYFHSMQTDQEMKSVGRYLYHKGKTYDFDPDKVNFADPKKGTMGNGFGINLSYPLMLNVDGVNKVVDVPVWIQSPVCETRWGYNYNFNYDSATLDVKLEGGKLFSQTMNRLEDNIKEACVKNAALWFKGKKRVTRDGIDQCFSGLVRSNSKTYEDGSIKNFDDSLRVTIKCKKVKGESKADVSVYDQTDGMAKAVDVKTVGEMNKIVVLFSFERLWIATQVFTKLVAKQILIIEKNSNDFGSNAALSIGRIQTD